MSKKPKVLSSVDRFKVVTLREDYTAVILDHRGDLKPFKVSAGQLWPIISNDMGPLYMTTDGVIFPKEIATCMSMCVQEFSRATTMDYPGL